MSPEKPERSYDPEALRASATKLATSAGMQAAIQAALQDRQNGLAAFRDPAAYFASHGVEIPSDLTIEVFERQPRTLPGPDWFPFVIEFFNCRTYWVRRCKPNTSPPLCTWHEETVCFGFRILPQFLPPLGGR